MTMASFLLVIHGGFIVSMQVYVAILGLSSAALLLTKHGICMALLYLQHMQDCLPRCVYRTEN